MLSLKCFRFSEWCRRIGRPDFMEKRKRGVEKCGYVCALHFEDEEMGDTTKKLRMTALPTKLIPSAKTFGMFKIKK